MEDYQFDLNEYFQKELDNRIKNASENIITETKDSIDSFFNSRNVFSLIREDIEKYIANEIGNRLRCGIYDHTLVKQIFDEKFEKILKQQLTQEMQKEIKELIRKEICTLITKL